MKPLSELTSSEFRKLQSSGLLHTIYPDTPKNYVHTDKSMVHPKPPEDIDWSAVTKLAKDHIEQIANGKYHEDNDDKQWFYETVMTTVYGKNVFDWINKNSR